MFCFVFNSNQSAFVIVNFCWVKAILFGDGRDFFLGVVASVEVVEIKLGVFVGIHIHHFRLNAVVQGDKSVPSGLSSVQN